MQRLVLRCAPLLLLFAALASCRAPFEPDDGGTLPPPPPPGPLLPLRIGALGPDYARAVATDPGGDVFVASYFSNSVDFDASSGATVRPASGPYDIAVARYGPDGTFRWVFTIGGTGADVPYQIKLGNDGSAYVTGYLTSGALCNGRPVLNKGGQDIFLMRITANGTCDWAVSVGSTGDDQGHDLAIESSGDVLVTGSFTGTVNFATGSTPAVLISRGFTDGFIARYAPDGSFESVVQFGGTGDDAGNAIIVRPDGDIMVAGAFSGTASFGSLLTPQVLVSAGGFDYFLARMAPTLGLQWAVRGGGVGNDVVGTGGIALALNDVTYISGTFSGIASVGPGAGITALVSHGDADIFIANYDANGTWASFARVIGGIGTDAVATFVRDDFGNFFLGGSFQGSVDFDPGSGVHVVNARAVGGAADAFVLSLDPAGDLRWVNPLGAAVSGDVNFGATSGISLAPDGTLWAVGRFFGRVDFDPGTDAVERQNVGDADQFVVRYQQATGAIVR